MGDDLHLATAHLFFRDKGLYAVDVIGVKVGVDHRFDRLIGDLTELGHDLARLAHRLARVDDDQPFRRLNHRHVAQLPAHRGVDITRHLIDLLGEVLGVRGQFRVDGRSNLFLGQCRLAGQGQRQAQQHSGRSIE